MDFFFEIPWYIPTIIALIGIAIFVWGNNRLRIREKRMGIATVLFAILMALVSYLVDTPREIVAGNTREFVKAIIAQDASAIAALLDPGATAFAWDKQQIVDGAIYYAHETGLTGARVISLTVEQEPPDIISYLSVWSQHQGTSRFPLDNLNSRWKLEWNRVGKRWLLRNIIPLEIGQTPREEIERRYLDQPVKLPGAGDVGRGRR